MAYLLPLSNLPADLLANVTFSVRLTITFVCALPSLFFFLNIYVFYLFGKVRRAVHTLQRQIRG